MMRLPNLTKYPLSNQEARWFGATAFLFVAGDYLTTLFAVGLFGASEGNILFAPIIGTPYLFPLLLAKCALVGVIYVAEVRTLGKHRIRNYTITGGLWLGVVLNNVLVILTQVGILTSALQILLVLYLLLTSLLWVSWLPELVTRR
jgi:hypothetical protein